MRIQYLLAKIGVDFFHFDGTKIGVDTAENEPSEIFKYGCRPTTEGLVTIFSASKRCAHSH